MQHIQVIHLKDVIIPQMERKRIRTVIRNTFELPSCSTNNRISQFGCFPYKATYNRWKSTELKQYDKYVEQQQKTVNGRIALCLQLFVFRFFFRMTFV